MAKFCYILIARFFFSKYDTYTVKLGNKERFDKEQIGTKEPFPVTNLPLLHKDKELSKTPILVTVIE